MHHLLLLLLLGTLTFFSYATEPALSKNVTLNSEIFASKPPSAWISRSGRFAFGFFPEGRGFRVGIWLQTLPNRTVVWVANRDDEPVSGDAKLVLTNGGRFLLFADYQGGSKPIFISDPSQHASSASLLDTGNLVIFNSVSETIWQSFDFPTDTLVASQTLLTGYQLVSSVSERNHSSGSFRLNPRTDGNMALSSRQSRDNETYAYWASGTKIRGNHPLLLAGDGLLSILSDNGSFLYNLSGVQSSDPKFTYRATLDADGFFRLYSHDFSRNGASVMVGKWPSTDDPCKVYGICGFNSYCSSIDGQHNCSCVPGFHFIDLNDWPRGCEPNRCGGSSPSNESILVLESEQIEWFKSYTYSIPPVSTQKDCADSCLSDSNCGAALFGSGACRKQKMPLMFGKVVNQQSQNYLPFVTLIKARNCNSSVEITTESSSSTTKVERRPVFLIFVGGALAAVAAVALGLASFLFYRSRRCSETRVWRKRGNLQGLMWEDMSLQIFSYDELRRATDEFKEELGRGAFGAVYKGTTTDGKLIAVKRLEKVIEEGEREFLTEMRSIGRTHHRNLLRLLGVCHEGQTRLLVYEYMSNGSLASFIFNDDDHILLTRLHWNDRVRVAVDVARGILYLHEDCDPHIIHCDIKPQNILMDASWTAKISDFGLAKLLTPDQTRTFTGVRGTRGYLAPEWYKNMPISVKADVYSFGMVLLETICCRRNVDIDVPHEEMILTEWVYRCFRYGELLKLVKAGEEEEEVEKRMLERMVMVGLWCIQEEPALRPTMKMVMSMLEGNLEIPVPPTPDSRNY